MTGHCICSADHDLELAMPANIGKHVIRLNPEFHGIPGEECFGWGGAYCNHGAILNFSDAGIKDN